MKYAAIKVAAVIVRNTAAYRNIFQLLSFAIIFSSFTPNHTKSAIMPQIIPKMRHQASNPSHAMMAGMSPKMRQMDSIFFMFFV